MPKPNTETAVVVNSSNPEASAAESRQRRICCIDIFSSAFRCVKYAGTLLVFHATAAAAAAARRSRKPKTPSYAYATAAAATATTPWAAAKANAAVRKWESL